MIWIQLAAGLLLLFGGGEALVRGSVGIAMRLGVSPLLIGLTLVGFGTSTPELVASLEAALYGAPAIAIGNVIGSNIANILLILGAAALVLPIGACKRSFRRDGAVLLAASLLLLIIVIDGEIGRLTGAVFLVFLVGYVTFGFVSERRGNGSTSPIATEAAEFAPRNESLAINGGLAIGGIAAVLFGASLLIKSAIFVARDFGISEAVIGLTLVALGTSLPELATAVMAAFRRHGDVAFGNIVGSNIFNILGIAGATALVTPFAIPSEILNFDIWVMLAATAVLISVGVMGWRVGRLHGIVLLAVYGAYVTLLLSR